MTTRPQRIIFLVGVGHSGSTVLEMLLATSARAIGLGEAWDAIGEEPSVLRTRRCSCGRAADDCDVWKPTIDEFSRLPATAERSTRYDILLHRVRCLYGDDVAVIDSSKKPVALKGVRESFPGADLRVIHSVRDVRAYTVSAIDKAQRNGSQVLPERAFRDWYLVNRLAHGTATAVLGSAPLLVMHEAVCLATDRVVARLHDWLGRDYVDLSVPLNSGPMHSIKGNRVRLPEHAARAATLRYDYSWLARREWLRPYVLLPNVRKYNERCLLSG